MNYYVIRHSAEPSDDEIAIDEGVEIIDAPYPEHGKTQVPKRCFIYDDADGYPEGYDGYIEHHGILGMKWGVRRYQNNDGSLTNAGRKRYGVSDSPDKKVLAVVPAGTLPESTRITGKEESEFWKAYAKHIIDSNGSIKDSNKDKADKAEKASKSTRSYTPEQQKQKLDIAKKTGNYDMLFLEAIQNTKMEYDNDSSAINSAYKEYLKDPEAFFTMDYKEFYKKYPQA